MFKIDYYGIGQRIRKIRKANSLSQEELASRIDISITHMSHIETGNTKLSLQVLVDIANELNVTTDELLFEKEKLDNNSIKPEIQDLLNSCTLEESKVLNDVLKATKVAINKYL